MLESNAYGANTLNIDITATVHAVYLDLNKRTVNFNDTTPINKKSTPITLTFTNKGTDDISLANFTISNNFTIENNNCLNKVISENQSCTLNVAFNPILAIVYNGELRVDWTTEALDSTQSITSQLSGEGIKPVLNFLQEIAGVAIDRLNLAFGEVHKDTSAANKKFVIKNTGKDTLNITNISLADFIHPNDDFALANNSCNNAKLAKDKTCSFEVSFRPIHFGGHRVHLIVETNDGNLNQTLTGTGTGTDFSTDNANNLIDFGEHNVETTRKITFTNTGYDDMTFTDAKIENDDPCSICGKSHFIIKNNGCSTIKTNESCEIEFAFEPHKDLEVVEADFSVSINGTDYVSHFKGKDEAPLADITGETLVSSVLQLGNVDIGSSATQKVTITNKGTDTLILSSFSVTGTGYTITDNACTNLAPKASCKVTLQFKPTAINQGSGTLSCKTNDVTQPTKTITLKGNPHLSEISLSVTKIDFGSQRVGQNSASKSVKITNTGNNTITLKQIIPTGDFTIDVNSCNATLAPNANCTVSVIFKPSTTNDRTGNLKISSDDMKYPLRSVSLTGQGIAPLLTVSSNEINFGDVYIYPKKAAQKTLKITNSGTDNLVISSITLSGTRFSVDKSNCNSPLAKGGSCNVIVSFPIDKKDAQGKFEGNIAIKTDGGNETIPLQSKFSTASCNTAKYEKFIYFADTDKTYARTKEVVSWDDAISTTEAEYANLVIFNNAAEKDFVLKNVQAGSMKDTAMFYDNSSEIQNKIKDSDPLSSYSWIGGYGSDNDYHDNFALGEVVLDTSYRALGKWVDGSAMASGYQNWCNHNDRFSMLVYTKTPTHLLLFVSNNETGCWQNYKGRNDEKGFMWLDTENYRSGGSLSQMAFSRLQALVEFNGHLGCVATDNE